jgi:2-keto-4-pentenoate hydratase/2-oxohepta-3-ene-1,7-dioic acid hydratase in catechol pathway
MNKVVLSTSMGSKQFSPTKIVCVGLNYVEHIEELNSQFSDEPVIFMKPPSALSDTILTGTEKGIHYEGKISFLIENGVYAGVAVGFDLTKRELQAQLKSEGRPWERSKAFDASAVFSAFVPFDVESMSQLRLDLELNGQLVQCASYDLMIYKPEFLLGNIKEFVTLEDGDIVMTGTPKGEGEFAVGDRFTGKLLMGEELLVEQSWVVESLS